LLSRIAQGYQGIFRKNVGNKKEMITAKMSWINWAGYQNCEKQLLASPLPIRPSVRPVRKFLTHWTDFLKFDVS
jgi:hypothetical protein